MYYWCSIIYNTWRFSVACWFIFILAVKLAAKKFRSRNQHATVPFSPENTHTVKNWRGRTHELNLTWNSTLRFHYTFLQASERGLVEVESNQVISKHLNLMSGLTLSNSGRESVGSWKLSWIEQWTGLSFTQFTDCQDDQITVLITLNEGLPPTRWQVTNQVLRELQFLLLRKSHHFFFLLVAHSRMSRIVNFQSEFQSLCQQKNRGERMFTINSRTQELIQFNHYNTSSAWNLKSIRNLWFQYDENGKFSLIKLASLQHYCRQLFEVLLFSRNLISDSNLPLLRTPEKSLFSFKIILNADFMLLTYYWLTKS